MKALPFRIILYGQLIPALLSCRFIEDLTHMEAPCVESCTMDDEGGRMIFSQEMNRNLTEEAFSLTLDSEEQAVSFTWTVRTMEFTPIAGVAENGIYSVTLSQSAEDRYGNSLASDFSRSLYRGDDHIPPEIITVSPAEYTVFSTPRDSVTYKFSEPVDTLSFTRAFSISPDLLYHSVWDSDCREVSIELLEDCRTDREYLYRISSELTDRSGNSLTAPSETLYNSPVIETLAVDELFLTRSGTPVEVSDISEALMVEKDDSLTVRFNRGLSSEERYGLVSILPGIDFDQDWDSLFGELSITFPEPLSYGEVYEIIILENSYFLICSGEGSIPLNVESVRFKPDGESGFRELTLNSSLGAVDSDNAVLEIEISRSPLSDISMTSFLESFSISSGVLSINFRTVNINSEEDRARVQILMDVSGTGLPGTVTLSLDENLRDSLNNRLAKDWALTVLQP